MFPSLELVCSNSISSATISHGGILLKLFLRQTHLTFYKVLNLVIEQGIFGIDIIHTACVNKVYTVIWDQAFA